MAEVITRPINLNNARLLITTLAYSEVQIKKYPETPYLIKIKKPRLGRATININSYHLSTSSEEAEGVLLVSAVTVFTTTGASTSAVTSSPSTSTSSWL
jgi:hypothetical protein